MFDSFEEAGCQNLGLNNIRAPLTVDFFPKISRIFLTECQLIVYAQDREQHSLSCISQCRANHAVKRVGEHENQTWIETNDKSLIAKSPLNALLILKLVLFESSIIKSPHRFATCPFVNQRKRKGKRRKKSQFRY